MLILINHYFFNNNYYFSLRFLSSLFFSFFFSLLSGFYFLKLSKKFKVNQFIKSDVPTSHLVKSQTPTMGGIIIVFSIIFTLLIFSILSNVYIWYVVFILLSYGTIGFIDDYFKIFRKNNKGLTAICKYLWLSAFAIILIYIIYINNFDNVKILFNISLLNNFKNIEYSSFIFFLLSYFIIVGFSNSVNLTDGLDSLAILLIVLVFFGMACLSFITSSLYFSNFFEIDYIYSTKELTIVCSSIIGASLGFLWFNSYPAKIFMGDVGSLSLGGVIGLIAVLLNQELLLIIMGGLFILESLSVIIQVLYFKYTKKRMFLMSPIHHHYELKGYKETTIVMRMWIISWLLLIISLFCLLL